MSAGRTYAKKRFEAGLRATFDEIELKSLPYRPPFFLVLNPYVYTKEFDLGHKKLCLFFGTGGYLFQKLIWYD